MTPSIEPLPVQDLDALLIQSLGKDFQIEHVEWKPLTDPGENFGSVILAINATITRKGKTEILHLVGKLPPRSAYLLDLFNSPVTFKKELHFYSKVAKEILNIQIENGVHERDLCTVAPKYLGGRLGLQNSEKFDEQAAIVLENLKYTGYDTEDRILGLDKKHIEFAVEKLAKLHATIIALKIKKPRLFENVVLSVLKDAVNETAEKCVVDMILKAHEDLKNISEAKPYLDRINRTIEYGMHMKDNAKVPEEPWATLVHNDFWANNMMFRNNDRSEPIDMKIVDFQLCLYDYGVKDLIFFLVSSSRKEILDNNLDEMINLYYDCFIECLSTLKLDIGKFSKTKFDEIVNYCGPIKFNQCIMMAQVIQASRETAPEIKDTDGEEIFLGRVGNDIYNQKLLHIVSVYDRRGWLMK